MGHLLVQVTADDKHTIHVWRWMPHSNKYINAHYIPGWYLGPDKKLQGLRSNGGCGTCITPHVYNVHYAGSGCRATVLQACCPTVAGPLHACGPCTAPLAATPCPVRGTVEHQAG